MNRNIKYILSIVAITLFLGISVLPDSGRGVVQSASKIPVVGSLFSWINSKSYHLGLDLRGGVKLVYDLETSDIPEEEVSDEVSNLIEFVRDRRVDQLGVSEPKIYSTVAEGQHHMVVELPGYQADPEKAKAKIGGSVLLEFKERKESFSAAEKAEIKARNDAVWSSARSVLSQIKSGTDFGELAKEFTDDFDMKYQLGNYGFLQSSSPELASVLSTVEKLTDGGLHPSIIDTGSRLEIVKREGVQEQANEKWRASHILINTQRVTASMTPDEAEKAHAANEEAKQLADSLIVKLQNGADFTTLAAEHSGDIGNKDKGGDLGFFGKGVMVDEFEAEVLSLGVGEMSSTPVKTMFGYHIVKVTDKQETEKLYNISKIVFDLESDTPGQWVSSDLTGKQFETAYVNLDQNTMQPVVNIVFNSEGANLFKELTKRNIGKPVAIFIDNALISAPVVRTEISEGLAVISGGFDIRGAQDLADNLNMGATPINFSYIGGSEISPSLGAESLRISLQAGIIGYILVAIYMIVYYRLLGLLSVGALLVYSVLTLSLYNIANVTLSLAGVAGFILSIGMAVDANILIFERMKEELRSGKGLSLAAALGFERAWTSIKDSNISSLITCALLLLFGSGLIRGFAFTLGIGILVSMFTAITVTRLMVKACIDGGIKKRSLYTSENNS